MQLARSSVMVTNSQENRRESPTNQSLVDYLRRNASCTIGELVKLTGVTSTAIRQRLGRLMKQGLVERVAERAGRGRPTYRYSLSRAGERSSGDNYGDLAGILWSEIRAVKDAEIRHGLLCRIVARMADVYRARISGTELKGRMESVVELMSEREVPFEVREGSSGLPVLTALACPYPDLAEQDRSICSIEKMLFSELLGDGLRLTDCRLDGATCCTFETRPAV